MNQFTTSKSFQAKPSSLKKKMALIAFIAGTVSFTLAITGVINRAKADYFFAGGLVAMMFAFRFWNMQVRKPGKVIFKTEGVEIAEGSSGETIQWNELESIRYRAWRGGHFWEFKKHGRDETFDYYIDGLTSSEQAALRDAVSTISLPNVEISLTIQADDIARVVAGQAVSKGVGKILSGGK